MRASPVGLFFYAALCRVFSALSCLGVFALVAPAYAQEQNNEPLQMDMVEGIAAKINDDIVSTLDLRQRIDMLALFTGANADDEQVRSNLRRIAIRDLIEEKLKIQDGEKYEVKIDNDRIDNELSGMATQTGRNLEEFKTFLKGNGISLNSLRQQLRSSLVWQAVIGGLYAQRVKIDGATIDKTISEIRSQNGRKQFQLAEICLPVPDQEATQRIYSEGVRLIESMRSGGIDFSSLARTYSACPTAAVGGDMGWLTLDGIPPILHEFLAGAGKGMLTRPVPVGRMLKIFFVLGVSTPSQIILDVALLQSADRSDAARAQLQAAIDQFSCESTGDSAADAPVRILRLDGLAFEEMRPLLRSAISGLSLGQSTPVNENEDNFEAIFLCGRQEKQAPEQAEPDRDKIETRLYNQHLALLAERHIRNLKRNAAIDILVGPDDLADSY